MKKFFLYSFAAVMILGITGFTGFAFPQLNPAEVAAKTRGLERRDDEHGNAHAISSSGKGSRKSDRTASTHRHNGEEDGERRAEKIAKKLAHLEEKITRIITRDKTRFCVALSPGQPITPGWLTRQGPNDPRIVECLQIPRDISKKLAELATTTVDITSPIISSVTSTATTTSATVSWITNEPADSLVRYGTSTNYGLMVSNPARVINHALALSRLTASTTYHFQVESKDASGNAATSSDQMLITSAAPIADVSAPVISGIAASPASSTARVSWVTNESSTSKVYYSLVSPIDFASTSTLSISDAALVTNHSILLGGLTASSTHFFVTESADASGNRATSTTQSFLTAGG